jgi:predicted transcriptional regulator
MRTRTRIYPYVVPEIARRLTAYCGAKGLTESAAVQAAIEQYLDAGEKDNALILRRLDRLGRASTQHQRDLEVVAEALALFVRRWFASAPEIAPEDYDAVERLSAKRYKGFLDILAHTLARPSPRLVSDALRDAPTTGGTPQAQNPAAPKMPSPPR